MGLPQVKNGDVFDPVVFPCGTVYRKLIRKGAYVRTNIVCACSGSSYADGTLPLGVHRPAKARPAGRWRTPLCETRRVRYCRRAYGCGGLGTSGGKAAGPSVEAACPATVSPSRKRLPTYWCGSLTTLTHTPIEGATSHRDGPRRGGARRHHGGDPDVPRQSHPGRASTPHCQEHAVPHNREIRAGPRPPDRQAEWPIGGCGRWSWPGIGIVRHGSTARLILLAMAMDLPPSAVGPRPVLAGSPHGWPQGLAYPGAPRAHTRQRNVMMPRVGHAVMTSPQVISTDSRRMGLVPLRPQRVAHRRRRPLD
jgi:hypothetical protein